MSFICDKCHNISKPHEKMSVVVIDKRDKSYYYLVIKKQRNLKKEYLQYKDKIELEIAKEELKRFGYEIIKEFTTNGYEIAKENRLCIKCISDEK